MQRVLPPVHAVFLSVACLSAAAAEKPRTLEAMQPLLGHKCADCHQPGEIGPMPLTSYGETRQWAKAIKEAVLARTMPPWFADPKIGEKFRNDRSLSPEEIRSIVAWVDAGEPAGSRRALAHSRPA